jgi:trans-2-enoyl-CoA reductase
MQAMKKKLVFNGGSPARNNRRGHTDIVYALYDPRNMKPRYVGVTNSLIGRLNEHMRMYGGNTRKNAWIQELIDAHVLPVMHTVEVVEEEEDWREREVFWIQAYIADGADLLNDESNKYEVAQEAKEGA